MAIVNKNTIDRIVKRQLRIKHKIIERKNRRNCILDVTLDEVPREELHIAVANLLRRNSVSLKRDLKQLPALRAVVKKVTVEQAIIDAKIEKLENKYLDLENKKNEVNDDYDW